MKIFKTPTLLRLLFAPIICKIKTNEKKIYLTFDDGPIPEITPWVLNLLNEYNAKATFFCVGENVYKYPEIYRNILENGHVTGNHTYHHLKGWKTNTSEYFENIEKAERLINSPLFRPPHGQLKWQQFKRLQKEKKYTIIGRDVLTHDFDKTVNADIIAKKTKKYTTKGSIIVFHDSLKAEKNLKKILPDILKYFFEKGFAFESIPVTK